MLFSWLQVVECYKLSPKITHRSKKQFKGFTWKTSRYIDVLNEISLMPCMLSTLVGHSSGVALPASLSFEGIGGDTYHF
jgi:hypothetical protein